MCECAQTIDRRPLCRLQFRKQDVVVKLHDLIVCTVWLETTHICY